MEKTQQNEAPRHPIQVVVRRTGLKPDLIRAWERRYSAVQPSRSDSGRRIYTDEDVTRLRLLRQAIQGGRRIGEIASLDSDALTDLCREDRGSLIADNPALRGSEDANSIDQLIEPLVRLDAHGFDTMLQEAASTMSPDELITEVLVPMLRQVGNRCSAGRLRVYQEHLATVATRRLLDNLFSRLNVADNPKRIVVSTPASQIHELGALMAAVIAAHAGWSVLYLGVNLPSEEIAAAARGHEARAVALSIVHPPNDTTVLNEVRRLRRLMPDHCGLLLGGRAMSSYGTKFDMPHTRKIFALGQFGQILNEID